MKEFSCKDAVYITVFLLCGHNIKGDLLPDAEICAGKYKLLYQPNNLNIKDRMYTPLRCISCGVQPKVITLENTGETVLMNFTFKDNSMIPSIENGPLEGKGKYEFKHMYFNWIEAPNEWGYNDVHLPSELHLVFYNAKYENYEKALQQNEGIAVLSVRFRVRPLAIIRDIMEALAESLKDIHAAYTNTTAPEDNPFIVLSFLPHDLNSYYTYIGTMIPNVLGTMACKANVIWIDFEESLKITPEQAMEFSNLRTFYRIPSIHHVQEYQEPQTLVYNALNPYKDINTDNSSTHLITITGRIVVYLLILWLFT